MIKKDMDEIIMENPGCIRTGKDQMLKSGISDPRNKTLMKMFNMIGRRKKCNEKDTGKIIFVICPNCLQRFIKGLKTDRYWG